MLSSPDSPPDPDEQIIEEVLTWNLTDRADDILSGLPPEQQAAVARAARRLSYRSQRDLVASWRALPSDSRRVIDPPPAATWAWTDSEWDEMKAHANNGRPADPNDPAA